MGASESSAPSGTGVFRQPQLLGGEPNTKISCGEGVGVAGTSAMTSVHGPIPGCRQLAWRGPSRNRRGATTPVGQRINQRNHGTLPSLREGQMGRIDVGELLDRGKDVRQTAGRVGYGLAVGGNKPADVGTRRLDRHLLAEHHPQRQLRLVDRAWDALTGRLGDQRLQVVVGAQRLDYRLRIGVEIEQPSTTAIAADTSRKSSTHSRHRT